MGFSQKPKHVASKKDIDVVVTNSLYFLFDDRICNHVSNTNIHIMLSQIPIKKKRNVPSVTTKDCLLCIWNIYLQHISVQRDHFQVLHSCDVWRLSFCLLLSSERCEPN